jgi:GNAT superfamily N-acetyltransferase
MGMPSFRIRPAEPDDAAALVTLRATVFPFLVRGSAATRRLILEPPPDEDRASLVADDAGELVGAVTAYRSPRSAERGFGHVSLLHVHPDHRRRGVGAALLTAAADHLRAIGVRRASAIASPDALGFARRYGFAPAREVRYSALDLTARMPDPASTPPGLRLASVGELSEAALYAADRAATADEPGDVPSAPVPYAVWRYDIWDNPDLDREVSTAVLDGEAVVSFALMHRDGDRLWSDMTATVPTHRGRRLARLAKTVALRRAAAAGVRVAYTANDEANLPMLAVNTRLGYRPVANRWSCVTVL